MNQENSSINLDGIDFNPSGHYPHRYFIGCAKLASISGINHWNKIIA